MTWPWWGSWAVGFGLVLSGAAHAQTLTFEAAWRAAVVSAPEVLLGASQVAVAEAEIETAGTLPNPTLGVSTATESARLATTLAWPLALFGQQRSAARAARRDVDVARLDVELARTTARWGASKAWIDLWQAQAKAAILDGAVADAKAIVRIGNDKADAGQGARIDIVQSNAELARTEAERAAVDGEIELAGLALAAWLGGIQSDAQGAVQALRAAGEPPGTGPRGVPDLGALRARLAAHPLMQKDAAAASAAVAHVEAEQRARWPLIELQVGVNQFDPSFTGPELVFGVAVELPIFDQHAGPIARARSEAQVARTAATLDEQRLVSEAMAAYRALDAAQKRLEAQQRRVLPALLEVQAMTLEGYGFGRLDLLRVIAAGDGVRVGRLEELEARAAVARAVVDLDHALGAMEGGDVTP